MRCAARRLFLPALVAASLALAPAAAEAAPDCEQMPRQRVLVSGLGTLESIAVDAKGRIYFTDAGNGRLMFLPRRHAKPRIVAEGIEAPGGLAFLPDGSLLVGFGDAIVTGASGAIDPQAGLLRYDPKTGETKPYVEGTTMSNGVVRGPDGAIYASNDVGLGIDRIVDGVVERGWATILSSNGLVIDSTGRYLFAAQTFQPAAIARIELANPSNVETWFAAGLADLAAGPDGLARDAADNLYVAANSGGQVWKVANDGGSAGDVCSLATLAPLGPSALTFGRGKQHFKRRHLYVTTFQGELIQLKNVR